jgi:FAD:protein FMN transferase
MSLPGVHEPPPGTGQPVHRFRNQLMASPCEILIEHGSADFAAQAARAAFDAMARLESMWSRFLEHSDVGRLNQRAGGEPVVIMPETIDLLTLAGTLQHETEGAFDITAGSCRDVRDAAARAEAVEVSSSRMTARLREKGWRVDPGAIGKGLALDHAARLLREDWDMPAVLLSTGGSTILALAPPGGWPGWPVRIRQNGGEPGYLHLAHCAMSASGVAVRGAHIWDPRECRPAGSGASRSWGIAPTGGVADALSTAFFVLGIEGTRRILARHADWSARILPQSDSPAALKVWRSESWPEERSSPLCS